MPVLELFIITIFSSSSVRAAWMEATQLMHITMRVQQRLLSDLWCIPSPQLYEVRENRGPAPSHTPWGRLNPLSVYSQHWVARTQPLSTESRKYASETNPVSPLSQNRFLFLVFHPLLYTALKRLSGKSITHTRWTDWRSWFCSAVCSEKIMAKLYVAVGSNFCVKANHINRMFWFNIT